MRAVDPRLKASIQAEAATLTILLKIAPKIGTPLGFTRHPDDIAFDGLTYRASPGMGVSQLQTATGLSVDNLDASGLLDDQIITEADVLGGKYDSAKHELSIVDYEHLDYGKMLLLSGRVYEIRLADEVFTAQLGSLGSLLGRPVGSVTSPRCRVKQFGDAQCGINLDGNHPTLNLPYRLSGATITTVTGRLSFQIAGAVHPTGFFNNGRLLFTSGGNAGLAIEVKRYAREADNATGTFTLQEPLLRAFAVGEVFTVTAGCNRTYSQCDEYGNAVNQRAEPFTPGMRRLLQTK